MSAEGQPAPPVQHRRRWTGWLLYLVGYSLMAGDYADAGLIVFTLGMLCHWRFWRWALPLGLIAFWFGYWRGTRKVAERRRTKYPAC